MQIQANFIIGFISPVLSSVSSQVQHSFSTFGVARNNFFLEDISNSRTEVCNTMQIILVLDSCPHVTRTFGVLRLEFL